MRDGMKCWLANVASTSPLLVVQAGQTPGPGDDMDVMVELDGPPGVGADVVAGLTLAVDDRVLCVVPEGGTSPIVIGRF